MRGAIIVFVLGVVAGAIGLSYLKQQRGQESRALSASTAPSSSAETGVLQDVRDATISASDAAARKLDDWNLNSEDVKADLRNTGSVVRTKARAAGETIATVASKARVIGTIKAKYTLDNDLNARSINVDFDNGKVTLNGSVPSEAAIGKAVALALDTDGVTEVQSLLKVDGATS